jgi:isopentenyl-diphosphate delta-isomerase
MSETERIMLSEKEEIIDIVDERDCVLRSMPRDIAFAQDIGYRRAVLAFLKNKQGKLCFLRRTEYLTYLPNHYALVGGCVQAGELYDDAMKREVAEEVNIKVVSYKKLAIVTPQETQTRLFKALYEVEVDCDELVCCPTAFSSYVWLSPQEFCEQVKTCQLDPVAPDLCYLIQRFYK